MKPEKFVMARTPSGLVEVKAFHIWKEKVGGFTIPVALHVAPRDGNELMVSELSTGFDTLAKVMRPGTNERLTVDKALKMPGKLVKRQGRTAFHHLLKKVGSLDFLQSITIARVRVAQVGEELSTEHLIESEASDEQNHSPIV